MPAWNHTGTLDFCAATSFQIVRDAESGIWPYRTYVSSNVTPPVLLINVTGGPLQPGLLFFDQENSGIVDAVGEQAAFIMTDTGDLVYGLPGGISNFHTQTLDGRSVLTFRTGSGAAAAEDQVGYGYGEVHILDTGYQEIYTVCPDINVTTAPQAGNATCFADVHESVAVFAEGPNNFLDNGNSFMGYGALPYMKEYADDGTMLWSAQYGFDRNTNSSHSYRAFKQQWHARPAASQPSLVVQGATERDSLSSCAGMSVNRGFVSWNGATDVTQWNVYVGNTTTNLGLVSVITNKVFETVFAMPPDVKYVQVGAVESGWEVQRSYVVSVGESSNNSMCNIHSFHVLVHVLETLHLPVHL
ncbi:hypothetical protein LTS07_010700 [Exophiala sideris]|nr:hypothetical protein LTS07_010700 [Exophiala sideris]KAK5177042.1 hypothetical protein LTR44_010479 [Eurotiomycetes sp. CCFEE 6388]